MRGGGGDAGQSPTFRTYGGGQGAFEEVSPEELFRMFFGGGMGGSGFGGPGFVRFAYSMVFSCDLWMLFLADNVLWTRRCAYDFVWRRAAPTTPCWRWRRKSGRVIHTHVDTTPTAHPPLRVFHPLTTALALRNSSDARPVVRIPANIFPLSPADDARSSERRLLGEPETVFEPPDVRRTCFAKPVARVHV
jgi:hypothetical protein